ncbi:MAG: ABC transporter permease [Actinomycetota bacterium]|jgi:lipooligosaccharide transport system permease protein|nr:ABC transporter permease [Actinomycetota bacterium]
MSTPAAVRYWEGELTVYKRIWFSNVLGSFVQPMLYLLGIGVGVGSLIDDGGGSTASLGGVPYVAFFAPAILAEATMMLCAQDSLWPVMDGFMWSYRYRSAAATPLGSNDLVAGIGLWHATRSLIAASGVAVALLLFDDTRSWGLVPAIGFAVLTGLAFTMPISAWSASRESDKSFPAIMRFGILPMFLFGGAFYPVSELPGWLRPAAYATPLYHGIELCRRSVIETLTWERGLIHVGALVGFIVIGTLLCRRVFAKRLGT